MRGVRSPSETQPCGGAWTALHRSCDLFRALVVDIGVLRIVFKALSSDIFSLRQVSEIAPSNPEFQTDA